jgi:tetratricopeptide (TPR) repeat protein
MALGDYERVFVLTDKILNNQNRAFSELYYMRGKIYQEQGQNELARAEFEKAVRYNRNFELARQALFLD